MDRNANIFGVLHRAVRLIYYAREGMLRGASSWQMLNRLSAPGFGILGQEAPEKRFMLYWLYYYFNRHVGEQVLDMDGTAPYYTPAEGDDPTLKPGDYPGPLTPVLVTLSADGKTIYVVIANGSWDKTVPCKMSWSNFTAAGRGGVPAVRRQPGRQAAAGEGRRLREAGRPAGQAAGTGLRRAAAFGQLHLD